MRLATLLRSLPNTMVCWLALSLTACAGFRGGWQSVPYIGDVPPPELRSHDTIERARPPTLSVAGLDLNITIDNELRTSDTQVYLFVLPLGIDPRQVYSRNRTPGRTRVFVYVTPRTNGYAFNPTRAVLRIGSERYVAEQGQEFGQWGDSWNRVAQGGRWDYRLIDAPFELTEIGHRYLLSVDFATATPSPQSREIVLELDQAFVKTGEPALPPIRFAPARWQERYT